MRALVYYGPKDMRLTDVDVPAYGDEEALVRVKSTGICGSDVHGYLGTTGRRIAPLIMGHEVTGVIEKAGAKVKGFEPGDRVVIYPLIYCGECSFCKADMQHVCPNRIIFGVLAFNGSYTEYLAVPERNLFRLPDNVTFEQGALCEPLAVAVKSVRIAGSLEGKNVLILGAGIIGLLVFEAVKAQNPANIFITDVKDERLETARKLGAKYAINTSKEDNEKVITDAVGIRGIDTVIEAVGLTDTVQYGLRHLKQQGKCVFLGLWEKFVQVNMHDIVNNELVILGSTVSTLRDFQEAIDMLAAGLISTDVLISKVAPLDQGPQLFAELAKDPGKTVKVVLNS